MSKAKSLVTGSLPIEMVAINQKTRTVLFLISNDAGKTRLFVDIVKEQVLGELTALDLIAGASYKIAIMGKGAQLRQAMLTRFLCYIFEMTGGHQAEVTMQGHAEPATNTFLASTVKTWVK